VKIIENSIYKHSYLARECFRACSVELIILILTSFFYYL